MRISDCSSDVCSSDLLAAAHFLGGAVLLGQGRERIRVGLATPQKVRHVVFGYGAQRDGHAGTTEILLCQHVGGDQIGRASCRESVCQYGELSVVDVSLKITKRK